MTPLARLLHDRITRTGPLSVAAFMAEALGHPEHGYYRKRDPLGAAGDFITAPEISQMFGELIGLALAVVWREMGMPPLVRLVELGPGRGTLMADLLRAARLVPPFAAALDVHLVETSPVLRDAQRRAVGQATWHDGLDSIPDGPMLLVANEFIDALPIHQYRRDGGIWRERLIESAGDGFRFTDGPQADPALLPAAVRDAPDGAVAETCPAGRAVAARIARRLARDGGAAFLIDYGYARSAAGDSLQAVRAHAFHPVLDDPGEADITAHVDFQSLAEAAQAAGARAHGPVEQGLWLRLLGIEARAAALAKTATPDQRERLLSGANRLIAPREMGTLFKILALTDPTLPTPPGF